MNAREAITLEVSSDWLPVAEIEHLISQGCEELPDLSVDVPRGRNRGLEAIDPTIVAAIVGGVTGIAVPFVTKLAEKVFAKKPSAAIRIVPPGRPADAVVIVASVASESREVLVEHAFEGGTVFRVEIGSD